MTSGRAREHPLQVGAGLALVSAVLFGLSTPFVRQLGLHSGPFVTAALLYAGAAIASAATWRRAVDTPIRARNIPRIVVVALAGAVVAPACLAWGLTRTSAMLGSLLLASEAVFTVILARLFFREPVGVRVGSAVLAMTLGSALLVSRASMLAPAGLLGSLAVLAASLAWAADNALTRPLADLDPRHVVAAKGALGASLSLAIALALRERAPSAPAALGLLVTGGLGYGASLHLYLLAQRRIGAARTGSIFATAPFIGAVAAWAIGDGAADWRTLFAGAAVAVGLTLHLTERHGHGHDHAAVNHEHAHRHDDGHHDHLHDPPFVGEHSHPHRHVATHHSHPHGSDLHHQHEHGS